MFNGLIVMSAVLLFGYLVTLAVTFILTHGGKAR